HAAIDPNGYYEYCDEYRDIFYQIKTGLFEVPVVHCTYFIRYDVLDQIVYDDKSYRYEYVIFSDNARKKQIPQYFDNRKVYGQLTFADTAEDFLKELQYIHPRLLF
ncbi:MAG: hypothetical protein KAR79_01455, partial [Simkaniaceae bacterium]|nr:hypothetical protein [Simkaniaceae bacterium]